LRLVDLADADGGAAVPVDVVAVVALLLGLDHAVAAQELAEREQEGLGVMIFADDIFKYTSNMARHIPSLAEGTSPPRA